MFSPYLARVSYPGQFCLLKVPGVFLRRPLSIFKAENSRVEFLYKVIGKGTESLSGLKPGQRINVLGPLGNGYDLSVLNSGRFPVFVAGGVGIASLSFLAIKSKTPGILLYGAASKKDLIGLETFRKLRWNIKISTMDGTLGVKGLVTGLCDKHINSNVCRSAAIFSCGPNAMLKEVAKFASERRLPGFVSLEEMMACGTGLCQGCVVKTTNGYERVCKEGPVFDIKHIDWSEYR